MTSSQPAMDRPGVVRAEKEARHMRHLKSLHEFVHIT